VNDVTRHPRLYGAALAAAAMFPILMAGFAQAYVFYVLPEFRWASPVRRPKAFPDS
jgi:hypothetical protein